jgi:hypothetical protein
MMWQDCVFLAGNVFSLIALLPTLRDSMANVPFSTSFPSAVIGLVYATAFFTMDMALSALGALLTGSIWLAIVALRSPRPLRDSAPMSTPQTETKNATHSTPSHAD